MLCGTIVGSLRAFTIGYCYTTRNINMLFESLHRCLYLWTINMSYESLDDVYVVSCNWTLKLSLFFFLILVNCMRNIKKIHCRYMVREMYIDYLVNLTLEMGSKGVFYCCYFITIIIIIIFIFIHIIIIQHPLYAGQRK